MVSIIVPAYNAEKFIEETIESVLNQTYTDWELIVVNDGSSDRTKDIISNYCQKDNRIKLIDKKNEGVSATRNVGIYEARGTLIAFLDADDVWVPENLSEKVELLNNNEIDWVFCDMKLIDSNSNYTGKIEFGNDEDILKHYLLWDRSVVPGPCSNIVVKRKCIEDGLRFDSQFSTAADQDFCFNLSSKYKGKRIPKILWNYRVLTNSMSKNIAVMERDHIGVYKKALQNNLFNTYWFKQKCFSNLYLVLAGSWWVNGDNKMRSIFCILKSIFVYPPNILKLFKKIFK
jgi:glycosyltransferase involved in cell wall biosynthesis